jgi:hypothetical protein
MNWRHGNGMTSQLMRRHEIKSQITFNVFPIAKLSIAPQGGSAVTFLPNKNDQGV